MLIKESLIVNQGNLDFDCIVSLSLLTKIKMEIGKKRSSETNHNNNNNKNT